MLMRSARTSQKLQQTSRLTPKQLDVGLIIARSPVLCKLSKKGAGRKRALDNAAAGVARDLLLSGEFENATEVAEELHRAGLTPGDKPVHRTTLLRTAKAARARANQQPIEP